MASYAMINQSAEAAQPISTTVGTHPLIGTLLGCPLERGFEDSHYGRTISHQEMAQRLDPWAK